MALKREKPIAYKMQKFFTAVSKQTIDKKHNIPASKMHINVVVPYYMYDILLIIRKETKKVFRNKHKKYESN